MWQGSYSLLLIHLLPGAAHCNFGWMLREAGVPLWVTGSSVVLSEMLIILKELLKVLLGHLWNRQWTYLDVQHQSEESPTTTGCAVSEDPAWICFLKLTLPFFILCSLPGPPWPTW